VDRPHYASESIEGSLMADVPIRIWEFADNSERDNTGSNDGLPDGAVCFVAASGAWYYANTVGATSSSWTAVTAGSGTTLAATLAAGNTTGGTDLVVSAGDSFTATENASVPGGAPGAGTGKLWIKNDSPNVLVFTDDAGTDHNLTATAPVSGPGSSTDDAIATWDGTGGTDVQNSTATLDGSGNLAGVNDITLTGTVDGRDVAADGALLDGHVAATSNPHDTTLALALAEGATTGGTELEVSAGDPILLNENATVPGGAPAAGKGTVWVRSDAPNVLVFTDDAGTDTVLGAAGATPSLSSVLGAGDTTGGTQIEVSAGDPVTLNENASVPGGSPAAGKGKIWIRNDTPNVLIFTDDAGTDIDLTSGGSTPTLSQVLGAGAATGGDDLTVTNGDSLLFPMASGATVDFTETTGFSIATSGGGDRVSLDTSAGSGEILLNSGGDVTLTPGGDLVLDYATWPSSDGSPSQYLQTDGVGGLSWVSGVVGTFASTLVAGNTTGGTDVEVSAGDALLLVENAAVPWSSVATKGAVWVKDDAPNTLYFTDDAGTDFQIGGTGALGSDLATTLTGGNTTGGTDIELSSGDSIITAAGSGGSGGVDMAITAGAGDGFGIGGDVTITSGAGGASGALGGTASLLGGEGTSAGGQARVKGGAAASGSNVAGGVGALLGGSGDGGGNGGAVSILAGTAGATGAGGTLTAQAGTGGATSGSGGVLALKGGNGDGGGNGGAASLFGGLPGSGGNGSGGNATIGGGNGDGSGDGGGVFVEGGPADAAGTGDNGQILIRTYAAGSGDTGKIRLIEGSNGTTNSVAYVTHRTLTGQTTTATANQVLGDAYTGLSTNGQNVMIDLYVTGQDDSTHGNITSARIIQTFYRNSGTVTGMTRHLDSVVETGHSGTDVDLVVNGDNIEIQVDPPSGGPTLNWTAHWTTQRGGDL